MDCDVRLSSFKKILKSQGPGEYLFAMKLLFFHFDNWRQMLPKKSLTKYLVKLNIYTLTSAMTESLQRYLPWVHCNESSTVGIQLDVSSFKQKPKKMKNIS